MDKTDAKQADVVTIRDIARLAEVSIGTVDRVLHQRGRVAQEKVERIEALVHQYGYKPNLFASGLSGTRMKTIAVLAPELQQDHGYWELCLEGMRSAALELEPLQIRVKYLRFDRNLASSCVSAFEEIQKTQFDGLVLAPTPSSAWLPLLLTLPAQLPLIFFDTDLKLERRHCFIGQNPYKAGFLAARLTHLQVEKDKDFATINFVDDDQHLRVRQEGFMQYCHNVGRTVLAIDIDSADSLSARRQAVSKALDRDPNVGGLFVPNASVAEYVELKPDVRLLGFDLIPRNLAALRDGSIDGLVSQRPQLMGAETIRQLSRFLLFGKQLTETVEMPLDIYLKENI